MTVPGYDILGELGRGGMGVVYKARHRALNRLVALKMILAGAHAGPEERRRFVREAEAVARLQHPNIVQIHEVGEHEGRPFLSLEFCAGGSLADRLGGTPLPAGAAARLVETLARAMHAAHQAGIIHRDLKPANVLLAEDGTPKVTDFGLAKKLDGAAGQTASGAIMGTPSYMTPEQAGGRSKEVGPPTDVYALGAILYELLTGRPPFRAATALDTVLQVVSEEPVPPSRLQPKLPKDLETVCLECLQKDRRRRYATAEALAEELRRFQEGRPVQARPVGIPTRVAMWARRNPVTATGLLAAVAGPLWAAVACAATACMLFFQNQSLHVGLGRSLLEGQLSSEATGLREAVLHLQNLSLPLADQRAERNLDPDLRASEVRNLTKQLSKTRLRDFQADAYRRFLESQEHCSEVRLIRGATEPWVVYVEASRPGRKAGHSSGGADERGGSQPTAGEYPVIDKDGIRTDVTDQAVVDEWERQELKRAAVVSSRTKQPYVTGIRVMGGKGAGDPPALLVECITPVFQTIDRQGGPLRHQGPLFGFVTIKADLAPILVAGLEARGGADRLIHVADEQGTILAAWRVGPSHAPAFERPGGERLQDLYPGLGEMFRGPRGAYSLQIDYESNRLRGDGWCRRISLEPVEQDPPAHSAVLAVAVPHSSLTLRMPALPMLVLGISLLLPPAALALLFWRALHASGPASVRLATSVFSPAARG
ncbi:MAG TPA: serine/threonine-protein kinase [Gemmataceae bacterium]|nr:serine/threonine-protein kinase [Gemmataceae bacterium]